MAGAAAPQGRVFRPADAVMLNGNAGPMVHGIGKPVVARLSSDHDAAFSRRLGDGCDSGQTAQRRSLVAATLLHWPRRHRMLSYLHKRKKGR